MHYYLVVFGQLPAVIQIKLQHRVLSLVVQAQLPALALLHQAVHQVDLAAALLAHPHQAVKVC